MNARMRKEKAVEDVDNFIYTLKKDMEIEFKLCEFTYGNLEYRDGGKICYLPKKKKEFVEKAKNIDWCIDIHKESMIIIDDNTVEPVFDAESWFHHKLVEYVYSKGFILNIIDGVFVIMNEKPSPAIGTRGVFVGGECGIDIKSKTKLPWYNTNISADTWKKALESDSSKRFRQDFLGEFVTENIGEPYKNALRDNSRKDARNYDRDGIYIPDMDLNYRERILRNGDINMNRQKIFNQPPIKVDSTIMPDFLDPNT